MAQPTVTLFARIPPELNDLLEKRAAETGDSKNKIVTEALEKYVVQSNHKEGNERGKEKE